MIKNNLFDYPNKLQKIFDKLNKNKIESILVGGYVRDKFLNLNSKDIDIELYGVTSYKKLEKILEEFGEVNSVGKSFGVCKLSLEDLDLDFTLPRVDNKINFGHRGFEIKVDTNLDFKSASSRRDFTINAIGFNTKTKKILDPFHGQNDIKNKMLRAVNIDTFTEDPLRVLRLVGFASRFNFSIEDKLFLLCKQVSINGLLSELPQERIYTELEKILLKSKKPSLAFSLLKDLNALKYLHPLETLHLNDFHKVLDSIDNFAKLKTTNNKTNMYIMLSLLCYNFTQTQRESFITNVTRDKIIFKNILSLTETEFYTNYSDSDLLKLATQVNIRDFLLFWQSIRTDLNINIFIDLKNRANNLEVLEKEMPAYLQGRDLIKFGLEPSEQFTIILNLAYEAQMDLEIQSHADAQKWLRTYLKSQ